MQQEFDFQIINGKMQFPCIEVVQPIGTFYIASIPCEILCAITYSDVRRIEGERKFESYFRARRKNRHFWREIPPARHFKHDKYDKNGVFFLDTRTGHGSRDGKHRDLPE